jgi:hypothetical protein
VRDTIRIRAAAGAAAIAFLAIVGLLAAAAQPSYLSGYNSRIPAQKSVAVLRPGQRACESPVTSPRATDAVATWGGPVRPLAHVAIVVQDAKSHRVLATGRFAATRSGEHIAALSARVGASMALRICLRADLDSFSILGTSRPFFSVALLQRTSLLDSLPTTFSRAALFRPSWVGSWTFWLLAAGLLAAFAVGVYAALAAASEDDAR